MLCRARNICVRATPSNVVCVTSPMYRTSPVTPIALGVSRQAARQRFADKVRT
jgi:hypothetical protein